MAWKRGRAGRIFIGASVEAGWAHDAGLEHFIKKAQAEEQ